MKETQPWARKRTALTQAIESTPRGKKGLHEASSGTSEELRENSFQQKGHRSLLKATAFNLL